MHPAEQPQSLCRRPPLVTRRKGAKTRSAAGRIALTLLLAALVGCRAAAPTAAPAVPGLPTSASVGGTSIVAIAPPAQPCCPKQTLPQFLGLTGLARGIGGLLNRLRNRLGGIFPGLEAKPEVLAITDPANLESPNPAVKAAAEVKAEEDAAAQKAKAISYLAGVGCAGCYPQVEQALLDALDDCTEEVRFAAVSGLRQSGGEPCRKCRRGACCSPKIREKLEKLAYERDETGCHYETSERVRRVARLALCVCSTVPLKPGQQPLPIEGPDAVENPAEARVTDQAPPATATAKASVTAPVGTGPQASVSDERLVSVLKRNVGSSVAPAPATATATVPRSGEPTPAVRPATTQPTAAMQPAEQPPAGTNQAVSGPATSSTPVSTPAVGSQAAPQNSPIEAVRTSFVAPVVGPNSGLVPQAPPMAQLPVAGAGMVRERSTTFVAWEEWSVVTLPADRPATVAGMTGLRDQIAHRGAAEVPPGVQYQAPNWNDLGGVRSASLAVVLASLPVGGVSRVQNDADAVRFVRVVGRRRGNGPAETVPAAGMQPAAAPAAVSIVPAGMQPQAASHPPQQNVAPAAPPVSPVAPANNVSAVMITPVQYTAVAAPRRPLGVAPDCNCVQH